MGVIIQDYIQDYIRNLIVEDDPLLLELEAYAQANNVPIIHPEVKQLLRIILKSSGIKTVLEVGTAIGYSAIVFSQSMGENSQVTTIENNESMKEKALSNISKAGIKDQVKILYGDANTIIHELSDQYDCIFLDGAKGHYIYMLDACLNLLKPAGVLISDNVLFRGMIASDSLVQRRKITIVKRMRHYLDKISHHPRLITSIIPIGDGLALSYKKDE